MSAATDSFAWPPVGSFKEEASMQCHQGSRGGVHGSVCESCSRERQPEPCVESRECMFVFTARNAFPCVWWSLNASHFCFHSILEDSSLWPSL